MILILQEAERRAGTDTAPDTGERKLHPLPGATVRIGARLLRTRGLGELWLSGGSWETECEELDEPEPDLFVSSPSSSSAQRQVPKMFQHSNNKKCFTIESLVGKEANGHSNGGGSGDEPIRPTALRFPESLHPAAAAGVFGTCFQGSGGRTLYSTGPDMVLQEPGTHTQSPGGLPLHPLQIPPQSFFSPQHRDALSFYPWVLRSRYLGHRFQGESEASCCFCLCLI